jgi:hypothetical protein
MKNLSSLIVALFLSVGAIAQQPQSRLRIYDYKKIYADLSIPISEETFREGNLNELKTISLADKFFNKPLEEIAKSHCHFISSMTTTN